ncbi:MAG: hypothetical protein K0U36_04570 [Alphaproteobacteria bacterium]|nr:hypothetical protein [Alphaproteobacteria bacterium]
MPLPIFSVQRSETAYILAVDAAPATTVGGNRIELPYKALAEAIADEANRTVTAKTVTAKTVTAKTVTANETVTAKTVTAKTATERGKGKATKAAIMQAVRTQPMWCLMQTTLDQSPPTEELIARWINGDTIVHLSPQPLLKAQQQATWCPILHALSTQWGLGTHAPTGAFAVNESLLPIDQSPAVITTFLHHLAAMPPLIATACLALGNTLRSLALAAYATNCWTPQWHDRPDLATDLAPNGAIDATGTPSAEDLVAWTQLEHLHQAGLFGHTDDLIEETETMQQDARLIRQYLNLCGH